MPKLKTNRGAAKRFKVTAGGRIKRRKAFANHILTKKTRKRKRNLRQGTIIEDARMSEVLRRLHRETFVLSLYRQLDTAPDLKGFDTRVREDCELEVEKGQDTDMNSLFAQLNAQGIHVISLRNKANRLEEMFMRLVENKGGDA